MSSGLHYLSDEIELNSQFQNFISNLEITFEGSDPGRTRSKKLYFTVSRVHNLLIISIIIIVY